MGNKSYSQIFVKDIENNMIIGRDVLGSNGEILLAEGFEINEGLRIRRLLNQHNILFVRILNEQTNKIKEDILREKDKISFDHFDNKELVKVVNKITENRESMKKSFDKFVKGEKVEKADMEEKITNTLNVFEAKMNVFQIMQSIKHLDDITYSHCHNVALVSYTIGRWMGLEEKDLQELALSGFLIDIGKIRIEKDLLNKVERLTNDEFVELKKHSTLSYEIIKDYEFIGDRVKDAVLLHHERMDGSGYPLGIKGEKIPMFAKIVAIADIYNALISDRPYRDKKTPFEAIKILETEYMEKLDTNILYIFLRRIASNYIGQKVLFNSGERGEIIFMPQHNLFRPVVKIYNSEDVIDLSKAQYKYLDIVEFT